MFSLPLAALSPAVVLLSAAIAVTGAVVVFFLLLGLTLALVVPVTKVAPSSLFVTKTQGVRGRTH